MQRTIDKRTLGSCYRELAALYMDLRESEQEFTAEIEATPESNRASLVNFIHYLALRRHDIRKLQMKLGSLGLSSLGRLEAHVLTGIESVLCVLESLIGIESSVIPKKRSACDFQVGDEHLSRNSDELLGSKPLKRSVRIMVTLPSEAAEKPELLKNLMQKGMDVARINCAHDSPVQWKKMIQHLKMAEKVTRRTCKILMDLEGPKLRTGLIVEHPRIIHFSPQRDRCGQMVAPADILIYPESKPISPDSLQEGITSIPVEDTLAEALTPGDMLMFDDAAGRKRSIVIIKRNGSNVYAHGYRGVYLNEHYALRLIRGKTLVMTGHTGTFPDTGASIKLFPGDLLKLTTPDIEGSAAIRNSRGKTIEHAHIPCTLPQVFKDVLPGERIFFDDGKIGGTVLEASDDALLVKIISGSPRGTSLRSDKGINLPDTNHSIPPLAQTDLEFLDFIVKYADIVGFSFVREPGDIELLHQELKKRTRKPIGIVLKIENGAAFANLPRLLITALRKPPVGIMVARGDLGVEVGFERMSEVQEQILWLGEAAHVPVIWATQVLEQMNKKGMPTRSEVTDAAMSSRAECVMLNKGPFVIETMTFLENVLVRMQDHHHKKTAMLRKLKVSEGRWRNQKRPAHPMPEKKIPPPKKPAPRKKPV